MRRVSSPVIFILFSFIVFSLALVPAAISPLECEYSQDACTGAIIFRANALQDGRAAVPSYSSYDWKICCKVVGESEPITLDTQCSGLYDEVVRLEANFNARVRDPTIGGWTRQCISADMGTEMDCFWDNNDFCAPTDVDSNMRAFWRFEEDSEEENLGFRDTPGDKCLAIDDSGWGHHGDLEPTCPGDCPVRVDGIIGRALWFNDGEYKVHRPNDPDLHGPSMSRFTLMAWIYPDTNKADIIYREWGAFSLHISETSSKLAAAVWASNTPQDSPPWHIGSRIVPVNEWSFVVFRYDGSRVKLWQNSLTQQYVVFDGPVNAGSWNGDLGDGDGNGHFIGNCVDDSCPFQGIIDEVRIYDRALSDAEITAIWNNEKPGTPEYEYECLASATAQNWANVGDCYVHPWKMCCNFTDGKPPEMCAGNIGVTNDDLACGSTDFTVTVNNLGTQPGIDDQTVNIHDEIWTDPECDGVKGGSSAFVDDYVWTNVNLPANSNWQNSWTSGLMQDGVCYLHTTFYCSRPFDSSNACAYGNSLCWQEASAGNMMITSGTPFTCNVVCSGNIAVSNDDITCGFSDFTVTVSNSGTDNQIVDINDQLWTDPGCNGVRGAMIDGNVWTNQILPAGGNWQDTWSSSQTANGECYLHTIFYCTRPFDSFSNQCGQDNSLCWQEASDGNIMIETSTGFQCNEICEGTISVTNDDLLCGASAFTVTVDNTGTDAQQVDIHDELWTDPTCMGVPGAKVDESVWTDVNLQPGMPWSDSWTSSVTADGDCYVHRLYYCSKPFDSSSNLCGQDTGTCYDEASNDNIISQTGYGFPCQPLPNPPLFSDVDYTATLDSFSFEWNTQYDANQRKRATVRCVLYCDLETENCDNAQACEATYLAGPGGCTIINPDYQPKTETGIDEIVTCEAYNPDFPSEKEFFRDIFVSIGFEYIPSNLVANIGDKITWPVTIRNIGVFDDNYTVNITAVESDAPYLEIDNNILYSDLTLGGQAASLFAGLTPLASEDISFTVNITSHSGLTRTWNVMLTAQNISMPDFGFFGIFQIILIASAILVAKRKSL